MSLYIPIILIIICLIIIFFIILKKFPALAILDVKEMPGEKEAEFKEKIIRQRLERDLSRFGHFFLRTWKALSYFFNNILVDNYKRLKRIKLEYSRKKKLNFSDRQEKIDKLFLLANEAIKEEDWEKAEEKLIEIVSLDIKNILAFSELANLYYETKKYKEAKDTWEHILKLYGQLKDKPDINIQEIKFNLAESCQKLNELDNAIEYVSQALDGEPNNPRFLDLIFDLSIMKKDKNSANQYFERLMVVDPANQKLIELKDKIKELDKEEKEN